MIPMYIEEIQANNINGLVLSTCELDELKQVEKKPDATRRRSNIISFRFFQWRLVIGFCLAIGFERNEMKNGTTRKKDVQLLTKNEIPQLKTDDHRGITVDPLIELNLRLSLWEWRKTKRWISNAFWLIWANDWNSSIWFPPTYENIILRIDKSQELKNVKQIRYSIVFFLVDRVFLSMNVEILWMNLHSSFFPHQKTSNFLFRGVDLV